MIYSGTENNHTVGGTSILESTLNNSHQGTTYIGYMYNDDDLVVAEYPSQTPNNLSGYQLYTNINFLENYYFTSTRPICSITKKTCSFTCNLGQNCVYTTWSSLNINYDKSDSMSTSTIWKYISDYKYTCFGHDSVIQNSDGSKTISCKLTEEIMGVEGNSDGPNGVRARIKYYGVFSPSYESSVTNKTDSNVKKVVDNWYKTNIYDNNLESYLVNQVFCNDRSINKSWSVGNGYSWDKVTYYGPYHRLRDIKSPGLLCENKNDQFTLKVDALSTIKGVNNYGNNALNYPVGLITIDEVMLAGGLYNVMNSKYYLKTGASYWIASPAYISSYAGDMATTFVKHDGKVDFNYPDSTLPVRPVINLKSDIYITGGTGTESDPYVVE